MCSTLTPNGGADNTEEYRRAARALFHDGRQSRQFAGQPLQRTRVGYVPYENFVGRADIIFFSIETRRCLLGSLEMADGDSLGRVSSIS